MASKLEVEVGLKSSAEKVWESLKDATNVFPKALPDHYASIEVVEGQPNTPGSVRLVKYQPGGAADILTTKEKIEVVDEANKTLSYSVIEGATLKYYKYFKASFSVSPKGDGSSVKWSCEFEKASGEVPNPDLVKDFAVKTFQGLDAYLRA